MSNQPSASHIAAEGFCVTESAAQKIYELIADSPQPLMLQIGVVGGGCHGFKYQFKLCEQARHDDYVSRHTVADDEEIGVIIDRISYKYLNEATLDFRISPTGEEFVIKNPNKTSCSCGSSFA